MEVQDISISTGNSDFCEILYTTLIVTLRERSPISFSDMGAVLIDSPSALLDADHDDYPAKAK